MNSRCIVAALSLVCLFFSSAIGQTIERPGKISGRIITEQKKPVGYATVTLLRLDSSVVNGGLTDENGDFQIGNTDTGKFLMRISGIGFNTLTIADVEMRADAMNKVLTPIAVKSSAATMQEVQVTGERRMMELSIDKKVFNVEKNITSAGGSAADVLQNVPSVSVDVDGSVSLRGKSGVTILIDGKPATLLGGDIASALRSLPASSIGRVEVMTNPSAKYDAQGIGGIINIMTKRDHRFGQNGLVSAGIGTRFKTSGGINMNARNAKWDVFLNSNFITNPSYVLVTTNRINQDGARFNTVMDDITGFRGSFSAMGAEYSINEHNTITFTQNLNRMRWNENGTTVYKVFEAGDHLSSVQRRALTQQGDPFTISSSLDYKHKFSRPDREVTSNVTYAQTWYSFMETYRTSSFDSNDVQLPKMSFREAPARRDNKSLNAQADFTTPFISKKGKLDVGWKSQLSWFYSNNTPIVDSGDGPQPDLLLLINYDYNQQIHAAYGRFGDQVKNWTYNAGLRVEYVTYEGTSLVLGERKFTGDYIGLFPSAYLSYRLPKEQTLNLSYTRRTNRPDFYELMPYKNVANPQDTSHGNPALIPEFIHNTELSYINTMKGGHSLMGSVYYQYSQNLIDRYATFYPDGTRSSQLYNLNSGITYGMELTGRAQIQSALDMTANFNFFRSEISGSNIDPAFNNSGFSWLGKLNTNLRLPADLSIQLNGNYRAPKIVAQGILNDSWWLDVAVSKKLMKGRATLIVNASDIFDTRKYTWRYNLPQLTQSVFRDRETRIGRITFTYRFGKSDGRDKSNSQNGKSTNTVPEKRHNNLKTDDR